MPILLEIVTKFGPPEEMLIEKLADALEELGTRSGLAVHGILSAGHGIDELTSATRNIVRGA